MIKSMRLLLGRSVNALPMEVHIDRFSSKVNASVFARMDDIISSDTSYEIERVLVHDKDSYKIIEYIIKGENPASFIFLKRFDGAVFNMSQLLANRHCFVPSQLVNMDFADDSFCVIQNIAQKSGKVVYGEMAQENALYSLLHEIVHTWQLAMWSGDRHVLSYVMANLLKLNLDIGGKKHEIKNFNEKIGQYCPQIFLKDFYKNISEVDINYPNNNVILTLRGYNFFFEVDDDILAKAIMSHTHKEHHAWNIARSLFKNIFKHFLNIEVNEKNLKLHASNHLDIYNKRLNEMLRYDWRTTK